MSRSSSHLHYSINISHNSHLSQLLLYLTITMEFELNYSLHDCCFLKNMSAFMSLHSWGNWFCRLRLNAWDNQCSPHCVYIIWLSCGWIQHRRHREFQQLLVHQQRILSWYWLMLGRFLTHDSYSENVLHSIVTSLTITTVEDMIRLAT